MSCDILQADPIGCDCSGCDCRLPDSPCSIQCAPPAHLSGLADFADLHGIHSCDDWGDFFLDDTFTCAYLEEYWECDCKGCTCDAEPMCDTYVECKVCDTDVFLGNCDEIFEESGYELSCEISEASFGCDCSGCECSAPPAGDWCPTSCLGYTCDEALPVFGGDLNCESLESLGFDCYGCSQCEYYDICDKYRYGFSNGFIDNQPKIQAQQCDGSATVLGAFSFCDCANHCENSADCEYFDNLNLNCRLFAAGECDSPIDAGATVGIWQKS